MRNPDHLWIGAKALRDHIHQRLEGQGYTSDEIDRAVSGPIDGNRLNLTYDGEHVRGAWLYVEALRDLADVQRALRRGELEAARRHYAEAERNEVAAQRELAGERTSSRNAGNASKERKPEIKEIIQRFAARPGDSGELWAALWNELDREGMDPKELATPAGDLQYQYHDRNGKPQTISKRRFATRLSQCRKPQ